MRGILELSIYNTFVVKHLRLKTSYEPSIKYAKNYS